MNKKIPFVLNGRFYYVGTIVKIKKECNKYVGFHSVLKFTGYIVDERTYCFSSLENNWEVYKMQIEQVNKYIESVLNEGTIAIDNKRMNPKYIEGIVSAWIWYILAMFFAIFVKNMGSTITVWLLATFVFFSWRHRKIKGG